MLDMQDEGVFKKFPWRHPVVLLLGTIVIGALGSGAWDIFVKPLLYLAYSVVLSVITLGSQSLRDSMYASAALDQTAAPAAYLYMMFIMSWVSVFTLLASAEFGLAPWQIVDRLRRGRVLESEQGEQESTELPEDRKRLFTRIRRIFLVITGIAVGVMFSRAIIQDHTLLIWRSFHGDMRQCAPYLSSDQEELLYSEYAKMRSKADFETILSELRSVAVEHKLTLHSERLW